MSDHRIALTADEAMAYVRSWAFGNTIQAHRLVEALNVVAKYFRGTPVKQPIRNLDATVKRLNEEVCRAVARLNGDEVPGTVTGPLDELCNLLLEVSRPPVEQEREVVAQWIEGNHRHITILATDPLDTRFRVIVAALHRPPVEQGSTAEHAATDAILDLTRDAHKRLAAWLQHDDHAYQLPSIEVFEPAMRIFPFDDTQFRHDLHKLLYARNALSGKEFVNGKWVRVSATGAPE